MNTRRVSIFSVTAKNKYVVLAVISVLLIGIFLVILRTSLRADSPTTASFQAEDGSKNGVSVIADSSASNGNAVQFGSPVSTDGPLPYVLPSQAVLKESPKKVFAHYFTPYPLQINNLTSSSDYYAVNYLTPNGENGIHAAYGGLLRERPFPQPVGGSNWQLENMKTEVRRASEAGLDGFTVDILGISGQNWDRFKILLQAAPLVDPNFKIVLMPDMNGSGVAQGVDAFAAAMASVANNPAVYKLSDGRLVVSPFKAEGNNGSGVVFWTQFNTIMKERYGISVALVPCFLNYQANAAAFAPISYGFSNWGNRNPGGNQNIASLIADAHSRGKIWMQPVSLQDNRPNQSAYWEANNTENFRTTWSGADGGADWVQIPTWNDYSENAQIAPSTHIGWNALDINGYYLTKYKTGSYPAITKDVVYISHRIQPAAAIPTGPQTKLQTVRGSNTPRDKVEVMAFLKQPALLEVTIGGVVQQVNVPAGVSTHLFDLKVGSISAKVTRSSTVVASIASPFPVIARPVIQDLQYYIVGSARSGGLGSWND